MDSLCECERARVCNFCCMLLMGMSWLLNGSEMRQFAPQRIMLWSAWAATHVLDNSQPSCSHTHSALLRNYCVLVLSPFKCHPCVRWSKGLSWGEKEVLCLWVYVHLMVFVLFGTQAHSNMCSWVQGRQICRISHWEMHKNATGTITHSLINK